MARRQPLRDNAALRALLRTELDNIPASLRWERNSDSQRKSQVPVLACYTEALKARSALEGRVTIKFVITATGKVAAADVASSDMGATTMEECVARSVLTWRFPPPEGGGTVTVTYPFVLSLSGG